MVSNSITFNTSSNSFAKMTRVLLLVCAMLSAGTGALAQENTRVSNPDRPIVIAITDRIASFDPYSIEYWQFPDFRFLLYEALIYFDQSQNPIPELAESWEVSNDGKTWTIHLKPNVRFSNGELLTSEVVKATFIRAMESDIWHQILRFPAMIQSIETPSDNQVVFNMAANNPTLELIQAFTAEIAYLQTVKSDQESVSAGTGPYLLESITENEYRFAANPYHHLGRPDINNIVLRYYPNHAAAWAAFLRGEVDAIDDISHDDYISIKNNPKFSVHEYTDPFYYTLTINNEHPLLSDMQMRKALTIAIDKEDLITTALRGAAFPASGPYLPNTNSEQSISEQKFDLREARQILSDLGWNDTDGDGFLEKNGQRLDFTLLIDIGDNTKARIASRLKWQLFRIGVRLNIEETDPAVLIQERLIPGNYDLSILQFTIGINRITQLNLFWNSAFSGRTNIARFSDVDFNNKIGRIFSQQNILGNNDLFFEAASIPANKFASAFLLFKKRYSALSSDIAVRQPISAGLFFKSAGTWSLAGDEPNQ